MDLINIIFGKDFTKVGTEMSGKECIITSCKMTDLCFHITDTDTGIGADFVLMYSCEDLLVT